MKILLNNLACEVREDETLLAAARRNGFAIPSLCSAEGAVHKASCMVCVVKNRDNGQILPSCTTYPVEGMHIETESEELRTIRKLSLELLLSDHRADCEAPCSLVCPKGLEIEKLLNFYDSVRYREAHDLISEIFSLPAIDCDTCKAPCEKACRRGTVDTAVAIRAIIREIAGMFAPTPREQGNSIRTTDKTLFQSRLGRFTASERERLKTSTTTPSRCLHCACVGRDGCQLRLLATSAGIKRPRYTNSSVLPAMTKQQINSRLWFEQAKCIKCGLCVYNSRNGFTFKDRGFGMQVVLPEENAIHINEALAELCPTGALYVVSS
jgi:predicted molibdopterin-dependent oxidoreductase YjgC